MKPLRLSLPGLMGGFAVYAYAATAVSAAWFLRRDHGLDTSASIVWAALLFSPWVVVGVLIWVVLYRIRSRTQAFAILMALALPVVPLAALAATLVDRAMRGAVWSSAEVLVRTVDRLPVAILLYTAIAAAGLAAAYGLRVQRQRAEIDALNRALKDARAPQSTSAAPSPLIVSVGSRRVPVAPSDVEWIASAGNYAVVHWRDQEGLLRETLQTLAERLEPARFARSHRSTLINLARVATLQPLADGAWRVTMDSGSELVVSRTYRDAFRARLEGRSLP